MGILSDRDKQYLRIGAFLLAVVMIGVILIFIGPRP